MIEITDMNDVNVHQIHLSQILCRGLSVPNVYLDDSRTESEHPGDLLIDKIGAESTSREFNSASKPS